MRKDWMRKPAALASAIALMLALGACTADDDPSDPTDGVTDTTVSDIVTTTIADATTTTAAG